MSLVHRFKIFCFHICLPFPLSSEFYMMLKGHAPTYSCEKITLKFSWGSFSFSFLTWRKASRSLMHLGFTLCFTKEMQGYRKSLPGSHTVLPVPDIVTRACHRAVLSTPSPPSGLRSLPSALFSWVSCLSLVLQACLLHRMYRIVPNVENSCVCCFPNLPTHLLFQVNFRINLSCPWKEPGWVLVGIVECTD